MKQRFPTFQRCYRPIVLFFLLFFALPVSAQAITISGSLLTNTRWTKAQSPVILTGDLTIEPNITLTIEAGVVIQAKNNQDSQVSGQNTARVELIVKGTLLVNGSNTEATKFSCETTGSIGCWQGIIVPVGGKATLNYADIRDATNGLENEGTSEIRNSHMHHNRIGLVVYGGNVNAAYSLFYRNQTQGISLSLKTGDTVTLDHLTVSNNANYGIYIFRNGATATLQNSILTQNVSGSGNPYQIYASGSGFGTCTHNLIWSSRSTSTLFAQTCTTTESYHPLFVDEATDNYAIFDRSPARKWATDSSDVGAKAWTNDNTSLLHGALVVDTTLPAGNYTLQGDLVVRKGTTLTLAAGAKFVASSDDMVGGQSTSRAELIVQGTLTVNGTAANAVSFRGTSASFSNWEGIIVPVGGKATLNYADIRDAANGLSNEGTSEIRNSHMHHNRIGLVVYGGNVNAAYSLFYRNQTQGISLSLKTGDTVTLDHLTVSNNANYGIYIFRNGATATLQNSILTQNVSGSGNPYQIYASGSGFGTCTHNLIWSSRSTSTLFAQTCTTTVAGNPLFVDELTDDYHLTANSPARQKATNSSDLGAYSFTPTLAQIVITPATTSLNAGATQQYTAEAYDSNGGQITGLTFTWKVVNGGGSINATGLFTAGTTPGTYNNTIEASSGSIQGYASVTVNGPTIALVAVTPATITMQPNGQQLFVAAAYDSNNQRISGISFNWSLLNAGGTLTPSGGLRTQATFVAGSIEGNFTIQATATTGNSSGIAIATIKKAATLAKLTLAPATITLKVGTKTTFVATGEDSTGQPIATGPLVWSATTGTISQTGEYTAPTTVGTATVTAESGGIKGTATVQIAQGQAPTAPTLQSPTNGASVASLTPALVLVNSTDADGDKLTYTIEVASDMAFAQKVATQSQIAETPNTTQWTVAPPLQENKLYYWRAKASDGTLESPWSAVFSFTANAKNDPPSAPRLSYPVEGGQVSDQRPSLEVTNASDPEGSTLTYRFEVATDAGFQQVTTRSPAVNEGANGTTNWKVDLQLADGKKYYWRAKATDKEGLDGPWMAVASFTVSLSNKAPSTPQPRKPKDGETVTSDKPAFEVVNAVDPEGDTVTLDIEVDIVKTFDDKDKIVQAKIAQDGSGITTWVPSQALKENTTYFWRVRASDGKATTPWVFGGEFFVNSKNDAPTAPILKAPSDGDTAPTIQVTLQALAATDLDNDPLTYHFQVSTQQDFLAKVIENTQRNAVNGEVSWQPAGLEAGKTYYWRVRASDGKEDGLWSTVWRFVVQAQNQGESTPEQSTEALSEPSIEATPEDGGDENNTETTNNETIQKESGQGNESTQDTQTPGGGCGCQGTTPTNPLLWLFVWVCLVLWGRRRTKSA